MFAVSQKSADERLKYADMGGGFNNRVYAAARKARSTEELYALIKNKRYTMSRIRRAVTGVLIGNPAGLCKTPVPYLKVLAFNDAGRRLLRTLADSAALPVITKPAAVKELTDATEHAALEARATDIYYFCLENGKSGREFTASPVYVGKDGIE